MEDYESGMGKSLWRSKEQNDIVKQCKPTRLQRSSEVINNINKSVYSKISLVPFRRPHAKAGGLLGMYAGIPSRTVGNTETMDV